MRSLIYVARSSPRTTFGSGKASSGGTVTVAHNAPDQSVIVNLDS
jgi:hypothetical protein